MNRAFDVLAQQAPNPLAGLWMPMILFAVMFYFMMYLPQKRERQTREEMLKNLKKNDRVVTIGGVIGTVANISADGKEVTLKMEGDSKARFLRSAIQNVIAPEAESSAGAPAA